MAGKIKSLSIRIDEEMLNKCMWLRITKGALPTVKFSF